MSLPIFSSGSEDDDDAAGGAAANSSRSSRSSRPASPILLPEVALASGATTAAEDRRAQEAQAAAIAASRAAAAAQRAAPPPDSSWAGRAKLVASTNVNPRFASMRSSQAAAPKPVQAPLPTSVSMKVGVAPTRVKIPDGATPDDKARIGETVQLVNKLNGYRATYSGRIPHQFRPMYHSGMGLEMLRTEYEAVYSLVCAGKLPDVVKDVAVAFAEAFVKAHIAMGYGRVVEHRVSFDAMFKAEVQNGTFKDEFEQLEIEYAHWFSAGPMARLAGKTGRLYAQAANINMMPDEQFAVLRDQRAREMAAAAAQSAATFSASARGTDENGNTVRQ